MFIDDKARNLVLLTSYFKPLRSPDKSPRLFCLVGPSIRLNTKGIPCYDSMVWDYKSVFNSYTHVAFLYACMYVT